MKHTLASALALSAALGLSALTVSISLMAQTSVPEIPVDSNADLFKMPQNTFLGEVAGVATNSKGNIFVYTRTGHPTVTIGTMRPFAHGSSRMFQFDRTGKYVREIGKDTYGFMTAAQVRVDPSDNVWADRKSVV